MSENVVLARIYKHSVQRLVCEIHQLSTLAAYLFICPDGGATGDGGKVFVWVGLGCSTEDCLYSEQVALSIIEEDFGCRGSMEVIKEGSEDEGLLGELLETLWISLPDYNSGSAQRQEEKVCNKPVSLGLVERRKGSRELRMKFISEELLSPGGAVRQLSLPPALLTTRSVVVVVCGDVYDVLVGGDVSTPEIAAIKLFVINYALDHIPDAQKAQMATQFSSKNLKIYRKVTSRLFKMYFRSDSLAVLEGAASVPRTSRGRPNANLRRAPSIKKTNVFSNTCTDCVGDTIMSLLGMRAADPDPDPTTDGLSCPTATSSTYSGGSGQEDSEVGEQDQEQEQDQLLSESETSSLDGLDTVVASPIFSSNAKFPSARYNIARRRTPGAFTLKGTKQGVSTSVHVHVHGHGASSYSHSHRAVAMPTTGSGSGGADKENREHEHGFVDITSGALKIPYVADAEDIVPDEYSNTHDTLHGYDSGLVNAKIARAQLRTSINYIHPPRRGMCLCVLDLDHTLMDFSQRFRTDNVMRPYLMEFMKQIYEHYDIVIWSQTNWHWLDLKLQELNLLNSANFKICFALDKMSMFSLQQTSVKPLQVIWNLCPERWNSHNTVHVDDLARNFELNPQSGILVKAFYIDGAIGRPHLLSPNGKVAATTTEATARANAAMPSRTMTEKSSVEAGVHGPVPTVAPAPGQPGSAVDGVADDELKLLACYLVKIARTSVDFRQLDHGVWRQKAAEWGSSSNSSSDSSSVPECPHVTPVATVASTGDQTAVDTQ